MRTVTCLLIILAGCPVPSASAAGPMQRVVVGLSAALDDAVAASGSVVVRADHTLGFAVVLTPDRADLSRRLGSEVALDARGAGAQTTPVATAPNDPFYALQWGPTELDMPQAWVVEPGSTEVKVAVVDSGITTSHPDFADVPVVLGSDYVDDDAMPRDAHGHGTHVSGIIAATRDDATGVAGMARVTLVVIRVLDANNAGFCSDFASGIREAADRGAHVINISLYCNSDVPALRQAIVYAQGKGALVVTVSGNFQVSEPALCVTYPGRYPEPLTVAATSATTTPASFSCVGPAVDLAAPGDQIYSTFGASYGWMSGTSMAAPHVSGAAALIKAHEPLLTMAQVRERLESTAVDLGSPGRDDAYGAGLVSPVRALTGRPLYVPV